ncbi:hypothetical protein RJ639_045169 [Escallonia herrerae]|uniref:Rapid ALkalinization Factor n=1 Tax=Escallonia herrerae TaxID=1293975 RepID=A0AA88W8W6_9ASTE|nr:hypothetical protein RJ639_045169 [Escallonia herrerae]
MAMVRGMMVLCLSVLLMSSLMIEVTGSKYLQYPETMFNPTKECASDPSKCPPIPANKYTRGCSPITRCRTGRKLLKIKESLEETHKPNLKVYKPLPIARV